MKLNEVSILITGAIKQNVTMRHSLSQTETNVFHSRLNCSELVYRIFVYVCIFLFFAILLFMV